MKNLIKYAFLTLVFVFGVSAAANASPTPEPCSTINPTCKKAAPEVDPSLAVAGISLLAGTLAVVRARARK